MPRHTPLLRAVSSVLLLSFACQELAMAAGEVRPSIPANLGRTRVVTTSGEPGRTTLIHIEDAHDSLEAQRKIVSILSALAKDYNVTTVALEGGAGDMDTALFKTYPDQAVAKKAADDLLREGRLNAGEFFALTSATPIAVYGAEEKTLYRENLKAFRDLLKQRETIASDIRGLSRSLEVLAERVYSDEIKEIRRNEARAFDEEKGFTRRWERSKTLAAAKGVSFENFAQLKILEEVSSLEKEISFEQANVERSKLLEVLKEKLNAEDSEALVLRSLEYKAGKITDAAYYLHLAGFISQYRISNSQYPQLERYTKYLALFESLDLSRVFDDLEAFEDSVKNAFYKTEDERALAKLEEEWKILSHLVSGEASSKEYLSFRATERSEGVEESFIQDPSTSLGMTNLSSLLTKYHVPAYEGMNLERILKAVPTARRFYDLASKRDKVLLERTLSRMKAEGVQVAALVTGGFHTQGISQLIENKGLSYLVVLPKITDPKSQRPYLTIITRQKGEYVKSLGSPASKFKIMLGAPLYNQSHFKELKDIVDRLAIGLSTEGIKKWLEAARLAGSKLDIARLESTFVQPDVHPGGGQSVRLAAAPVRPVGGRLALEKVRSRKPEEGSRLASYSGGLDSMKNIAGKPPALELELPEDKIKDLSGPALSSILLSKLMTVTGFRSPPKSEASGERLYRWFSQLLLHSFLAYVHFMNPLHWFFMLTATYRFINKIENEKVLLAEVKYLLEE